MTINREDAWQLLNEYVKSPSLIRHCLAVEAAMRAYAGKYGGDPEIWGVAGLLHDFDYEKYPSLENHAREGTRILAEKNYPQEIIQAILGHSDHTAVARESRMAKCLYAVDELCGFVMALAYVRPAKLEGMDADSVNRNLKKKGFAAKINREEIEKGINELGLPGDEHVNFVIKALQNIAKELGF